MTAFATCGFQDEWGSVTWEMRSVNHRFLDYSIKLPEVLRSLEVELREILRQKIQRGRVECCLQYRSVAVACSKINVNTILVRELANACDEIRLLIPSAKGVNPLNILSWPGVLQGNEEDLTLVKKATVVSFTQTVDALIVNRAREGAALQKLLETKLQDVNAAVQKIRMRFPEVVVAQRLKLSNKLQDIQAALDGSRLEQEMVFFAQRVDICEEVERLATHIDEMLTVMRRHDKATSIGKRLDFLLQEFNREANTIASKSVDSEITKIAVDMKVCIEQMREQVQNIE